MIFKVLLFALGLTLVIALLKEQFRTLGLMLSLAGCVVIFITVIDLMSNLKNVFGMFKIPDSKATESIGVIVKILGVAYLTNFGSDICLDAGEKAVATALETAGKLIMLSMALPMLGGIFNSVVSIIGGSL